jgi:SAM-dependent methyltransferase
MTRPAATEETPCDLCGARDYELIATRDRERRPLRTVICRKCGLVWTNPRPSTADVDAYYATQYRVDYKGQPAPPLRKILRGLLGARDRRRLIDRVLRDMAVGGRANGPPQKVLDVGCGAGELVYLLRCGEADASGLEPGREYAQFAREVLRIPVQTATVATATVAPGSLDLVTMFHCLEHLPNPRDVLGTVRTWLRQGGVAVIEVPNVESTVQAPSHRFHYAHLYHFTAATLAALGEAAGLSAVRTLSSEDGGNVIAVFRRDTDAPRRPEGLQHRAAEVRSTLKAHTSLRHYLSATPYRRAAARLQRRWREDRLLRRLKTVDDVLRWAGEQSPRVL